MKYLPPLLKSVRFYSHFLILTLKFIEFALGDQSLICALGYDELSKSCLRCSPEYYRETLEGNVYFPLAECKPKDISYIFNKSVWISSSKCPENSPCDGSFNFPYDNLLKAFFNLNMEAVKFKDATINFYLLGSEHYVFQSHLQAISPTPVFFFRGLKANIVIQPWFCDLGDKLGCFQKGAQNVRIRLKTNKFYIFYSSNLSISDVIFDGSDIHISKENDPDLCLEKEITCCNDETIMTEQHSCFLFSQQYNSTSSSEKMGLFISDRMPGDASGTIPQLNITNCEFNNMQLLEKVNSGFYSLLLLTELSSKLFLDKIKFSNIFLEYGIVNQVPSSTIYKKIVNDIIVPAQGIVISNIEVIGYNNYLVLPMNPDQIYPTLFQLFNSLQMKADLKANFIHSSSAKGLLIFSFENSGTVTIKDLAITGLAAHSLFNSYNTNINVENLNLYDMDFQDTQKIPYIKGVSGSWLINGININSVGFMLSEDLLSEPIIEFSYVDSLSMENGIIEGGHNCYWKISFSNFRITNFTIYSHLLDISLFYVKNTNFEMKKFLVLLTEFYYDDLFFIWNEGPDNKYLTVNNLNISNSKILSESISTKIFNWPLSQQNDVFKVDGFEISSVKVRYYLSFLENSVFSFLDYKNILILNVPHPLTLVNLYDFQHFQVSNLTIKNSIIRYYVLALNCYYCTLLLNDITLTDIQLRRVDAFYLELPYSLGIFERFKITNFTAREVDLKIFIVVSLDQADLYDMTIDLRTDIISSPLDFIFYLYYGPIYTLKKMFFSVPQGTPLSLTGLFNINYIENIIIESIEADNFNCNPHAGSIAIENGIINFLASSTYMPEDFPTSASIHNISIKNSVNCLNGVMGFVSYFSIIMHNASFYNTSSYQGGAISIRHSLKTEFSLFVADVSKAFYGGAIYTYNVSLFLADNILVKNSRAYSGGAALFRGSMKSIVQNSIFYNLYANSSGGAITCMNTYLELSFIEIANSSSEKEGGALFISRSLLNVSGNLLSHEVYADLGGFLLAMECQNMYIKGVIIYNAVALSKGSAFQYIDCAAIKMSSVLLLFNKVPGGSGTINAESQSSDGLEFSEIFCANNIAIQGACFFLFTNNYTSIFNSSLTNNSGSIISISSPSPLEPSELRMRNLDFQGNNLDRNELLPDYMIIGEKADLVMTNVTFKENLFRKSFIYFVNCRSKVSLITFKEKESLFFQGFYPSLFEYHFCSVSIDVVNFKGNKNRDIELIYLLSSNISLKNSVVTTCITSDFSCVMAEKSIVQMTNVTFSFCVGRRSGALYFSNSSTNISNCEFDNNQIRLASISLSENESPNDIEFFEGTISIISNCKFKTATGTSIRSLNNKQTYIYGSIFTGSGLFNSRAVYLLESNTTVNATSFTKYSSSEGGGLYIENKNTNAIIQIIINSCKFAGNLGYFGGVFFVNGYFPLISFERNQFTNNQAISREDVFKSGIGAVGFCVCLKCNESKLFLKDNVFKDNKADLYGRTVISQMIIFHQDKDNNEANIFDNNLENSGLATNLVYFPLKLTHGFFEQNLTESEVQSYKGSYIELLLNKSSNGNFITSGEKFQYLGLLTDCKGDQLSVDFFSRAIFYEVASRNRSLFKIEERVTKCLQGVCFFPGVKVNTDPNSTFQLRLSIEMTVRDILPQALEESPIAESTATFFTRACLQGELFVEGDQTCFKCPFGKYSFSDPMDKNKDGKKCLECPENSECPGGNTITPLPGYWRASENSTLILECISKSSCLGNQMRGLISDRIHGLCEEFHSGVFCYKCENGYARNFPKDICRPCKKNVLLYFKIVIALVLILVYIAFQVHITFRANSASNSGILLKQLINHFQQIGMISLVDLGWTPDIKSYFSFQEYFSFLSEEFITIDCFVTDLDYDLLTQKIIFTNILPIFSSIGALVIWVLSFYLWVYIKRSGSNTVKRMFDKVRVSIMIIVYLLFPEILRKCFSLMNCIMIDDQTKETRLLYSPEIVCWESKHVMFILVAAFPGLILWGVITPLFIYNLLRVHRRVIMNNIRSMNKFSNRASLHEEASDMIERIKTGKLSEKNFSETKKESRFLYFFHITNTIKSRRENPESPKSQNRSTLTNNFFPMERVKNKDPKNFIKLNTNETQAGGGGGSPSEHRKSELDMKLNQKNRLSNFGEKQMPKLTSTDPNSTRSEKAIQNQGIFEDDSKSASPKTRNSRQESPDGFIIDDRSTLNKFFSGVYFRAFINKLKCCDKIAFFSRININRKEATQLKRDTGIMLRFLYKGYAPKMYFWEMVMFSKKFVLILIGSFNDIFPSNTKAILLLISMTFYIWLQTKYKPFEAGYLNNIEYMSLITSFLTANMGIMLFTNDLKKVSQLFLILIILCNVMFVVNWLRYLRKYVIKKVNLKNWICSLIFRRKNNKVDNIK